MEKKANGPKGNKPSVTLVSAGEELAGTASRGKSYKQAKRKKEKKFSDAWDFCMVNEPAWKAKRRNGTNTQNSIVYLSGESSTTLNYSRPERSGNKTFSVGLGNGRNIANAGRSYCTLYY